MQVKRQSSATFHLLAGSGPLCRHRTRQVGERGAVAEGAIGAECGHLLRAQPRTRRRPAGPRQAAAALAGRWRQGIALENPLLPSNPSILCSACLQQSASRHNPLNLVLPVDPYILSRARSLASRPHTVFVLSNVPRCP